MTSGELEYMKQIMELGLLSREWKAKAESLQRENDFLKQLLLQKGQKPDSSLNEAP